MADQTLAGIMARFRAVLEAAPLLMKESRDAFSHDRQPNGLLDNTYYLDDGGLISDRSVTNSKTVRLDRIVVNVAKKLNFAPRAAKESMATTLLTAERYIKADGPANSYHATTSGHRITRKNDMTIGSLTMTVDYDVNESTS